MFILHLDCPYALSYYHSSTRIKIRVLYENLYHLLLYRKGPTRQIKVFTSSTQLKTYNSLSIPSVTSTKNSIIAKCSILMSITMTRKHIHYGSFKCHHIITSLSQIDNMCGKALFASVMMNYLINVK